MRAYIYVATEGTNSDEICNFINNNIERLSKYFLFYEFEDIDFKELEVNKNISNNFDSFKQKVKVEIAHSKNILFILKNSQLYFTSTSNIQAIKTLLNQLGFNDIKILIYLKEQSKLILDLYLEAMKNGEIDVNFDFDLKNISSNLCDKNKKNITYFQNIANHKKTLEKLSFIFGKNNILVNILEKKYLKNGNLLDDFLSNFNINKYEQFIIEKNIYNPIDVNGVEFLKYYNQLMPLHKNGEYNIFRGNIDWYINKYLSNKNQSFCFSDQYFNKIRKFYKKDNEFIYQKYFNNKKKFNYKIYEKEGKVNNKELLNFINNLILDLRTKNISVNNEVVYLKNKINKFEDLESDISRLEETIVQKKQKIIELEDILENEMDALIQKRKAVISEYSKELNKEIALLNNEIHCINYIKKQELKRIKSLQELPIEKLDEVLMLTKAYKVGEIINNKQVKFRDFRIWWIKTFYKENKLLNLLLENLNSYDILTSKLGQIYFDGRNYIDNKKATHNNTIGIVIIVENIDNYFEECIDSLLNQSYQDIQILLINKNNNDQLEYLKKYAIRDKRIIILNNNADDIINLKNIGLRYYQNYYQFKLINDNKRDNNLYEFKSTANDGLYSIFSLSKNISINNVSHLLFLSSYSYLLKNTIEKCLKVAGNNDLVWFDCEYKTGNELNKIKFSSHHKQYHIYHDYILNSNQWLDMLNVSQNKIFRLYDNVMIKFDFLKKINFEFLNDLIFDDKLYSVRLFLHADSIYILNEILYYYRYNPKDILPDRLRLYNDYFSSQLELVSYYRTFEYALSAKAIHLCVQNLDCRKYNNIIKILYPELMRLLKEYIKSKSDPLYYKLECINILKEMESIHKAYVDIQYKYDRILVVVPMYMVEDYLSECVASILKQKYTNTIILLINDGSKDNSLKLALELAQQNSNIIVIDKNNEGQGSCRNLGIDLSYNEFEVKKIKDNHYKLNDFDNINYIYCNKQYIKNNKLALKADYIMFLDADDVLSQGCFAKVLSEINGADVVWFDYKMFADKEYYGAIPNWNRMRYFTNLDNGLLTRSDFIKLIEDNNINCFPFMVDGMISVNLLKNINLKLPSTGYAEDHYFGLVLFLSANKISVIKEVFYNYRVRSGSSCNFDNKPIQLSNRIRKNSLFKDHPNLCREYYNLRGYIKTIDKLIDFLDTQHFKTIGLILRYYNCEILTRLNFYDYSDDVIYVIYKLNQALLKHKEHTRAPEILQKLSLEYRIGKYLSNCTDGYVKRYFTIKKIIKNYNIQKEKFSKFEIADTEKSSIELDEISKIGAVYMKINKIKRG